MSLTELNAVGLPIPPWLTELGWTYRSPQEMRGYARPLADPFVQPLLVDALVGLNPGVTRRATTPWLSSARSAAPVIPPPTGSWPTAPSSACCRTGPACNSGPARQHRRSGWCWWFLRAILPRRYWSCPSPGNGGSADRRPSSVTPRRGGRTGSLRTARRSRSAGSPTPSASVLPGGGARLSLLMRRASICIPDPMADRRTRQPQMARKAQGGEATLNSELRSLFEDEDSGAQCLLGELWPERAEREWRQRPPQGSDIRPERSALT